jgi:hypothetical protein
MKKGKTYWNPSGQSASEKVPYRDDRECKHGRKHTPNLRVAKEIVIHYTSCLRLLTCQPKRINSLVRGLKSKSLYLLPTHLPIFRYITNLHGS